jgi:hypothetical protein
MLWKGSDISWYLRPRIGNIISDLDRLQCPTPCRIQPIFREVILTLAMASEADPRFVVHSFEQRR